MIASKMGVDRTGKLWAFNAADGVLTILSPEGTRNSISHITDVRDIDVQTEWGMAGLFRGGSELQVIPVFSDNSMHAMVPATIAPIVESSNVCWLGPDLVAISPRKTADRVLLFSLPQNRVTLSLGQEAPVSSEPGAHLVRTTLLRCDPTRGVVYSLNSFSGELVAFSRDGVEVHRGALKGTLHEQWGALLLKQIAEKDAEIKKSGKQETSYRAMLNWEHFSVAPNGEIWAADDIKRDEHMMTIIQFDPSTGEQVSITLTNEDCTSRHFTLWRDVLILFRPPHYPIELCTVIRKEVT